jgi:hypothetical protein
LKRHAVTGQWRAMTRLFLWIGLLLGAGLLAYAVYRHRNHDVR